MIGFYEDTRIRNKNKVYNQAQEIYDSLRVRGLTNSDIRLTYSLAKEPDIRNEILLAILKLAGGSNGDTE